ncbi:MAG: ribonuclease R [Flavobacteriales bacterium]|nr:ribonuclease R [Flavobacteriales bacterium]|tara:strand:- start:8534 stop:10666 length:2133 start_codon:yes stop_codon:yes gene_type:complete
MKKKKKSRKKRKEGFSNTKLFDLLLSFFRENPKKRLNYKQVSKALRIKEMGVKIQLIDVMKEMAESKIIEEIQRGRYRLIEKTTTLFSVVKNTNKKGVYVGLDGGDEIFIPREYSLFSLAGDEVEVVLFPKRKKKQAGEVIRVVERKKTEFVGVIDNSSSSYFLIPDDKRVSFDVFLNEKSVKKEHLNKKVLVRIEGWNSGFKNPVGRVIGIIGDINNHDTEINSILYDYGFDPKFPAKVTDSANKINEVISKKEILNRLDLRKTTTFTIDPKDAKDFDDALSVKKLDGGRWEIGVHIADVSYYVVEGGVIDVEAFERATSVYLVDRVIPMLPEFLSNNLCSLKPNVDRLAYSVLFEMDEDSNLLNYRILKTVIHSNKRFTYQTAQKIIDSKKGCFSQELLLLSNISKKLRKKRWEEGSIGFESSEVKFVLDDKKNPIDVFFKESLGTNHLIEEFMLLANKTIAKHIGFPKKSAKPFVYRVHDLPDNDKISSLTNIVKKLGYSINNNSARLLSKSLNVLLKNIKGKKEQQMVETLTIRSMAKAIYTTKNIGHYGLSFGYYSHFTSPIRRYPDLVVHRLLDKYISGAKPTKQNELEELCKHCSEKEKKASQAERDSVKYMQVKFLKNKVGEKYDGIISGVTEWGLYVEIIANRCEGLVRVSSIKDDHYIYDEKKHALIGCRSKVSYQLGQKIKIKIKKADLERKQMDFILV